MTTDKGENRNSADEANRNTPGDNFLPDQVQAAYQQSKSACLAHSTGDGAEEHLANGVGVSLTGVHVAEGSCSGNTVNNDSAHNNSVGGHQECTACQCGVEEVLAKAAVKLLDNNDCKEGTDDGHPPGSLGRHGHSHQKTGENSGQVADGVGLLHELAVAPLKEDCGCNGSCDGQQNGSAEVDNADDDCGKQSNDDVQHKAAGVSVGSDLGLICYVKHDSFFLFAHFLASFAAASASAFAFSLAALVMNMILAVLKAWVRGILAGQLKEQLPHSKQSVM